MRKNIAGIGDCNGSGSGFPFGESESEPDKEANDEEDDDDGGKDAKCKGCYSTVAVKRGIQEIIGEEVLGGVGDVSEANVQGEDEDER